MELIKRRLVRKLGICKIEDNVMIGVQLTESFPDAVEKNPSAIRTLSRPEQDEYEILVVLCMQFQNFYVAHE